MSDRKTQSEKILAHLQDGGKLTPIDALNMFGCFRLGGRIYDLRKEGHDIHREMVETPSGKHVARYYLPKVNSQ